MRAGERERERERNAENVLYTHIAPCVHIAAVIGDVNISLRSKCKCIVEIAENEFKC
jgi:hypothetical protein